MTKFKLPKQVAGRWQYNFKDIGETGAYEYHSHEFACRANLTCGEALYTRIQLIQALTDFGDAIAERFSNQCRGHDMVIKHIAQELLT